MKKAIQNQETNNIFCLPLKEKCPWEKKMREKGGNPTKLFTN